MSNLRWQGAEKGLWSLHRVGDNTSCDSDMGMYAQIVVRFPGVGARTRTDTILRLSHAQYRTFAEETKRVGKALNVVSTTDIGAFASMDIWALLCLDDVRQPSPSGFECGIVSLGRAISTKQFREAGRQRYECDWSQLSDAEIYPFLVQHEIGHVVDNFCALDSWGMDDSDPEVAVALESLEMVNEVLADRYAWRQVCDRPMALTRSGYLLADDIERAIERLEKIMQRKHSCAPLPAGQYRSVPDYMLATAERARYVGPDVSPELLERTADKHRMYSERGYEVWRQMAHERMRTSMRRSDSRAMMAA